MGNPFTWMDLTTHDLEGARAFYGRMFDWKITEVPMPSGPYLMIDTGAEPGGGMMRTPEPGVPTTWLMYIHTDDIHGAVARIAELDGKVWKEPTEIPGVGWIAVACDPQGAYFGLFQPQPADA